MRVTVSLAILKTIFAPGPQAVCLLVFALCCLGAPPGRAVQTVLARETFQGIGTLKAAQPGHLGTFAAGAWQKRAVGPRTAAVAAPGWSGDSQGAGTDSYYDLTSAAFQPAQKTGMLGCWVRFVDFATAGYYSLPTVANPTLVLAVRRSDGANIQEIGVTASGHITAATAGGYPTDGGAIAANIWYWVQITWATQGGVQTFQASYQPLGGSPVLIGASSDNSPAVGAHVLNQPLFPGLAGQDSRWRGRVGNVTLCSLTALSDARIPADDTAPTAGAAHWYVNAAIGNDGNDGVTPATAWQTVAKLNAEMACAGVFGASSYAAGDTVTIDTTSANLPLGAASLTVTTPGVNIVQLGGGLASPGELQAWTSLPPGGWSGPVAGTAHVYRSTLSESNPTCVLWEDDRWMNHPTGPDFASVQAALDATPGSFWTDGTTMYAHPFGDTNPAADRKTYTRSYLRLGAGGGGAAVQILAPNVHLSGLRVRKTCMADPSTNDPGAAYCYQTQGQLDGTMLVENCYGAYGSKHIFGYTDDSLTRQYTTVDCQAEQGSPYTGAGGQTVWVDYANNSGSNGTAANTYLRCTTLANTGLIGSTVGQYRPDIPVWISHNSGQGSLQFASCTFTDCNLAGGLATGVTAVLRFTRGSCRGGSFGPLTAATITGVNVPGGQPFAGAGQVIVRNCVIAVDTLWDGFEPAASGTVDYEGNTLDLSATVTNNDNHVLFKRAGALKFIWRDNLFIGSTAFRFGVLRQAQNTDQVLFDHNAYQNVTTVAYSYNDGTATADRTLAQWQALGEDAGSYAVADPMLDNRYFPALASPLTDAGADLGQTQDYTGRTFPRRRTIGALEPLSNFSRWQAEVFTASEIASPAVSSPVADPDGDALSNLLEYALHTNPKSANAAATTLGIATVGGQSYLTLSYRQLTYSADLSYVPQVSSDLRTWQSGPGQIVLVGSVDNGDGTATVTVRDALPLGAGPRRFLRLQVSAQ